MIWILLNASDVAATFGGDESAALGLTGGLDGGLPVLQTFCDQAVAEIRGKLSGRATLGAAGTIPAELQRAAFSMARYYFLNSLPVRQLVTVERKNEYTTALEELDKIAQFKAPVPGQSPAIVTVFGPNERQMTREKLRGL